MLIQKKTFNRNKEWIDSLPAKTILDIGACNSKACEYFSSFGYFSSFLDMIDRRKDHCLFSFIQHDISKIPWPIDKKYDLFVCSHILEHLLKDDIKKVLIEIDRLPHNCIVTVPSFGCDDHFTVEDSEWWLSFLNNNSKFQWKITNIIEQNGVAIHTDLITIGVK